MADKAPRPLPCFLSKQAVALKSCVIPQSFRTLLTFSSLWGNMGSAGTTGVNQQRGWNQCKADLGGKK